MLAKFNIPKNDIKALFNVTKVCPEGIYATNERVDELENNLTSDIDELSDVVSGVSDDLNNEIIRATESENAIQETINKEVADRQISENVLNEAINNEIARAKSVENDIKELVSQETIRAEHKEALLQQDIDKIQPQIDTLTEVVIERTADVKKEVSELSKEVETLDTKVDLNVQNIALLNAQVEGKANKTELAPIKDAVDSLNIQVQEKAEQKDVDNIKVELKSKANQSQVDSLKESVETKAEKTAVDSIQKQVNRKADIEDLQAVEEILINKADKLELSKTNKKVTSLETGLENTNSVLDALTGNVENLAGEIDNKQDKIEDIEAIRTNAIKGAQALDTIDTYGDIVTHNEVDFTSTQRGNEIEAIAKGRATGYVFDTVEAMNEWISEHKTELNLGDNLYIRDTKVPDYWWDGENAQELETQKVDLENYVQFTDVASNDKAGVIKLGSATDNNYTNLYVNNSGVLYGGNKTVSQYGAMVDGGFINKGTLENIKDNYVKRGVVDNTIPLTGAEQEKAQKWLGVENISSENAGDNIIISKSVLPIEYQELEYIESTNGTSYINTGIKIDANSIINCTYDWTNQGFIFGARQDANNYRSSVTNENNGNYTIFMGGKLLHNVSTQPRGTVKVHIEPNNIIVNDAVITATYGTNYFNGDCFLFTVNNNGVPYTGEYARTRIRHFEIVGQCNLIPARKRDTNEVGFYDTIRNIFLPNAGTGYFIAGSVVEGSGKLKISAILPSTSPQTTTGKVFNESPFIVVGSAILSKDGIAREFATGSYIKTNQINLGSNFEIVLKVKLDALVNGESIFCLLGNPACITYIANTGAPAIHIGNGTGYVSPDVIGNIPLKVNEWVYLKFSYYAGTYLLQTSYDKSNWDYQCGWLSSSQIIPARELAFGINRLGNENELKGSIDLTETKITVGGHTVIDGSKYVVENDIINQRNLQDITTVGSSYNSSDFTFVGSPTITEDGLCDTKGSNANYVELPYIDLAKKDFKITVSLNSSQITSQQCILGSSINSKLQMRFTDYNTARLWVALAATTLTYDINYPFNTNKYYKFTIDCSYTNKRLKVFINDTLVLDVYHEGYQLTDKTMKLRLGNLQGATSWATNGTYDLKDVEVVVDGVVKVSGRKYLIENGTLDKNMIAPAMTRPNAQSGVIKYSDGRMEQWGIATTSTNGETEFTLLDSFKDTNFQVFIEPRQAGDLVHYAIPSAVNKFKSRIQNTSGAYISCQFQFRAYGFWK